MINHHTPTLLMIKVQLTSEQQKEIEDFRRQASSKDSEKALTQVRQPI